MVGVPRVRRAKRNEHNELPDASLEMLAVRRLSFRKQVSRDVFDSLIHRDVPVSSWHYS